MTVTIDLSGRAAVVTGAASGIGRATASVLGSAGAAVVCADVDADGAAATASAITAEGGEARPRATDVSRRADVDALVAEATDAYGRLDVMCNVAGIMHRSAVIETEEADLERIWSVNFKGVLFGCQAAARVMVEQGGGSIVNVASAAVDLGSPGLLCYSVAKVGVVQLTRTLASEVGPHGVRVNAVAPGFVETGMTSIGWTRPDGTVDEEQRASRLQMMGGFVPLRRTGLPDDIAGSILFLASDASSFMTGQTLRPNGGATMPW